MENSSWRRAFLKRSDLRAKVAANIITRFTPDIPPPLSAGADKPPVVTPAVVPALLPSAPQANKRKMKTPASSSSVKKLWVRVPSSTLALTISSSVAPAEKTLPASNTDTSSLS